jgi:hypothetical protein
MKLVLKTFGFVKKSILNRGIDIQNIENPFEMVLLIYLKVFYF